MWRGGKCPTSSAHTRPVSELFLPLPPSTRFTTIVLSCPKAWVIQKSLRGQARSHETFALPRSPSLVLLRPKPLEFEPAPLTYNPYRGIAPRTDRWTFQLNQTLLPYLACKGRAHGRYNVIALSPRTPSLSSAEVQNLSPGRRCALPSILRATSSEGGWFCRLALSPQGRAKKQARSQREACMGTEI